MNIPRPEYPRPQFVRKQWINLNGEWDFQIDNEKCGEFKEFYKKNALSGKITVPFCPESVLSGIGNTDFMNCVWYKKQVSLDKTQLEKQVILHFGAVDYHSVLYVNGQKAGEHKGGYTSFSFNITSLVKEGENDITLCVYDDVRSGNQPAGKQSSKQNSYGCFYTRTTGIWQTVWLEFVNSASLVSVNYDSDIDNGRVIVTAEVTPETIGCKLTAKAMWNEQEVGSISVSIESRVLSFAVDLSEIHRWDIGQGNLYDIFFEISDNGIIADSVQSYFGLRTVGLDKNAFMLNGRKVFGRWVLDQGFYPDGIYTAPTDEALKKDIEYSMVLGFNGARLHEKVFEARFLYWADKLGYPVWGEHANWGMDTTRMEQIQHFLPEWVEAVKRDISHPSIIGWCPFNELWDLEGGKRQCDELVKIVYDVTKAIDPTRPAIDTSGNFHVATDIFDVHDYEQDPVVFKEHYAYSKYGVIRDTCERDPFLAGRQKRNGEPLFVSEYGGIGWDTENQTLNIDPENTSNWSYGSAPRTEAEFIARYDGLTTALLDNEDICGFCYTQLYDVEQERNGLLTYDRRFKFNPDIIKKINTKKAAIED